MRTILTFGQNEDHFKHFVQIKTIHNKHYENEDHFELVYLDCSCSELI